MDNDDWKLITENFIAFVVIAALVVFVVSEK